MTGALNAIGRRDAPPTPPHNLVGDFGGGALYLALGVVAALYEARTSGRGQTVDAAMVDGAASLMTSAYSLRAAGISDAPRGENHPRQRPPNSTTSTRPATGRYVSIAPVEPKFYAELLERIGLDPGEAPHSTNRADWSASKARLAALFRTRTRDEWCEILEGTDACFAPVLGMDEAHRHPHNVARGTFVERDGIVQPNAAPRFGRTPGEIRCSPPRARKRHAKRPRRVGLRCGRNRRSRRPRHHRTVERGHERGRPDASDRLTFDDRRRRAVATSASVSSPATRVGRGEPTGRGGGERQGRKAPHEARMSIMFTTAREPFAPSAAACGT